MTTKPERIGEFRDSTRGREAAEKGTTRKRKQPNEICNAGFLGPLGEVCGGWWWGRAQPRPLLQSKGKTLEPGGCISFAF